jgi:hypothetical protein
VKDRFRDPAVFIACFYGFLTVDARLSPGCAGVAFEASFTNVAAHAALCHIVAFEKLG